MSARNRIDGLRKQVDDLTEDQTVMAISKIMDELSAAAAGGEHASQQTLSQLFAEATADSHHTGETK